MAENPNGIYPGTCRSRNPGFGGGAVALRLALPAESRVQICDVLTGEKSNISLTEEMGDFVVLRKDGIPSYQVASLVDDMHYGINLVVRGKDLLTSTAAQLQLANVMGFDQFLAIEWHHHPLIKNEQGQKLSKSAGDTSVRMMIEKGLKKEDIIRRIASLMALPEKSFKTLYDLQFFFNEHSFIS
jgi:glutamyl-tRNA synthetase